MNYRRIFIALLAAVTAAAASSCEPALENAPVETGLVRFSASVASYAVETKAGGRILSDDGSVALDIRLEPMETETRGSVVTALTDYGVYGFQYQNTGGGLEANIADGICVSASSNTVGYYRWGSTNLLFCAWAPYSLPGLTRTVTGDASGPVSFRYGVPADVSSQVDVLFAQSAATSTQHGATVNVTLPFKHALAGVKYAIEQGKAPMKDNPTITAISLKGLKSEGTADCSGSFGSLSGYAVYTFPWEHTFRMMDAGPYNINGSNPLFVIPQSLAGCRLEVAMTIKGANKTIGFNFTNQTLTAGTMYTLKLDFTNYNH